MINVKIFEKHQVAATTSCSSQYNYVCIGNLIEYTRSISAITIDLPSKKTSITSRELIYRRMKWEDTKITKFTISDPFNRCHSFRRSHCEARVVSCLVRVVSCLVSTGQLSSETVPAILFGGQYRNTDLPMIFLAGRGPLTKANSQQNI